jgi:ATP-binding cassette subfamily F protein 3
VRPMTEGAAYNYLGRFLFSQPMAHQPVSALSGGEKSRLQMALLVLEAPNFLLLDEPTNNFDIQSAEILEAALADYGGTVLVVAHDRYFLDAVATRIVELSDGGVVDYPDCNFTGYLEEQARRVARRTAVTAPPATDVSRRPPAPRPSRPRSAG